MSRRKKRQRGGEDGSGDRWLVTYSDLITLLLIFFILMYTMSQVDTDKYKSLINNFSLILTGEPASLMDGPGPSIVTGESGTEQQDIAKVKQQINEYINENKGLAENIIIYEQERGLIISFKDAILFPSGSDEILPQAYEILLFVAESLKGIPNYIKIEGHTDNRPINTTKFPSNWELSAARATQVVHIFENAGISSEKLSTTGFSQHRPIAPNDNEKNMALNRRVDIVILKDAYDYFEPGPQEMEE